MLQLPWLSLSRKSNSLKYAMVMHVGEQSVPNDPFWWLLKASEFLSNGTPRPNSVLYGDSGCTIFLRLINTKGTLQDWSTHITVSRFRPLRFPRETQGAKWEQIPETVHHRDEWRKILARPVFVVFFDSAHPSQTASIPSQYIKRTSYPPVNGS